MSDIVERINHVDGNIVAILNGWADCLDIPSGPYVNEDLRFAADTITRQNEVIEKLVKAERAILDAIPAHYLLDPPDGGSVTVVEAVTRLTAEVERLRAVVTDAIEIVGAIHIDKEDDEVLADLLDDLRAALSPPALSGDKQ